MVTIAEHLTFVSFGLSDVRHLTWYAEGRVRSSRFAGYWVLGDDYDTVQLEQASDVDGIHPARLFGSLTSSARCNGAIGNSAHSTQPRSTVPSMTSQLECTMSEESEFKGQCSGVIFCSVASS
jgi:hypothetical protein